MSFFCTEGEANKTYLKMLWRSYVDCDRCPLSECRSKVVFGSGCGSADLLIIGEAPGEQEDKQGLPFVGKSGKLLRRCLRLAGFDLVKDIFVTNTVLCRPERNRKPTPQERSSCLDRLIKTVDILRPRVILLVGSTAGSWAKAPDVALNRGLLPKKKWPELPATAAVRLRSVVLTYHPSWVLRQPTRQSKRTALLKLVADLKKTKKALHRARETV